MRATAIMIVDYNYQEKLRTHVQRRRAKREVRQKPSGEFLKGHRRIPGQGGIS